MGECKPVSPHDPTLIQGDVREHLPIERIPLKGDVLGLGHTTSIDNGELAFLQTPGGDTTIYKCQASDGGIRPSALAMAAATFPTCASART